jgi:hypothetical protein
MAYDFSTIKDPMVQQYLKEKYGSGDKVAQAQEGVDQAQMVGAATSAADSLANAFNQPVILENRMQDLGKAPSMVEGKQQKTDVSGLQKQAQMKLDQARSDEDNAVKTAFEQRKAELAAEAAAKKAEEEQRRFDLSYAQKDRDIVSQARSRAAYADAMMGLKRDGLELQRQKLEADKAASAGSGGKPISGELASKLSGYDAADAILKDLGNEYDTKANGYGSWIASKIPGTDANSYKAGLKPKVQALGTALEGGKLTDADFDKYMEMVPIPGDTESQRNAKLEALKSSIKAKRDAEANTLRGAGYKVPGSNSFPRTVTNDKGETATVSNEAELSEANQEGFK